MMNFGFLGGVRFERCALCGLVNADGTHQVAACPAAVAPAAAAAPVPAQPERLTA